MGMGLIRIYQAYLSPDHSKLIKHFPNGYCKFSPTCSEFTYEAIERYGLILGSLMGMARIIRCNPWAKGRYYPLPKRFTLKRKL